jgi:flagellar biogenesis protein FliO
MFIVLALIVGVIYLVYWFLKKGARRKVKENDLIRVLGSKALTGNRALHLVEAAGGVYLIGSSDGGVELIAEIKDKESLDTLKLRAAQQVPAARKSFQEVLSEIFKPAKKSTPISESIELLKGQRDRLRKM